MSSRDQFDISNEQREIVEWRTARREKLRAQYLKELHNPNRKGALTDEAILRFMSMRTAYEHSFKPTFANWVTSFGALIAVYAGITYFVKKQRDDHEHAIRTGQISYRDRQCKFV